ncbi:MAG: hypothetical protein HQM15_12020, partial [Deltaproteobacteria bacterium]|nr:hypothetical protein [Deltaproteobacteria bacterium]
MSSQGGTKRIPTASFIPVQAPVSHDPDEPVVVARLTALPPTTNPSTYASQNTANRYAQAPQAPARNFWTSGWENFSVFFDLIPFVGCAPEPVSVPAPQVPEPIPEPQVCVCGNHLPSVPPGACPPLSSSVLNQRIETILAYNSMSNVRQLVDHDCRVRPILSRLLQDYDPCLSITDLDARFDSAFRDLALPGYCSPSAPSATRMTPEFLKNLV